MATALQTQNFSIEQRVLNPLLSYDQEANYVSNTRWSKVWEVAAVVTAVAFLAFPTFIFLYATTYYPVHLPVISILLFGVGMPSSFRAFKYFWDKRDLYKQEASIDQKLIDYSKKINTNPSSYFKYLGIRPEIVGKPLYAIGARHWYFLEEVKRHLEISLSLLPKDRRTIKEINFSDRQQAEEFHRMQSNRVLAKNHVEKAVLYKLKAAYCLHLMQNPFETRSLSDFYQFVHIPYPERIVAKESGDPSAEILIKTSKKNYTTNDLFNKSECQLMREIFQKKSWWWPFS